MEAEEMSDTKQVVLVAARSLSHFLNEIRARLKDHKDIQVYSRQGRIETPEASFRYVRDATALRGHHGIKFEVWGPYVDWVAEALLLIKNAEHE